MSEHVCRPDKSLRWNILAKLGSPPYTDWSLPRGKRHRSRHSVTSPLSPHLSLSILRLVLPWSSSWTWSQRDRLHTRRKTGCLCLSQRTLELVACSPFQCLGTRVAVSFSCQGPGTLELCTSLTEWNRNSVLLDLPNDSCHITRRALRSYSTFTFPLCSSLAWSSWCFTVFFSRSFALEGRVSHVLKCLAHTI